MRKSILVVFFVVAAVFAMGVSNGHATGTITVVEKFTTLTKPLCLDTLANSFGFPPDGLAVYPYQDQYGVTASIPLNDFLVQSYDPTFDVAPDNYPFDPAQEFNSLKNTTVTVKVQGRNVNSDFDNYTQVMTTGKFAWSKKMASGYNQFKYANSFNVTQSRNQRLDQWHLNWDKNKVNLRIDGLRYHNFGPYWAKGALVDGLINGTSGLYNDIMYTMFDMDAHRSLEGVTPITVDDAFFQNVEIEITTEYTHKTLGTVKHTYRFNTEPTNDFSGILLTGQSNISSATVTGCDGSVINKEGERLSGSGILEPILLF